MKVADRSDQPIKDLPHSYGVTGNSRHDVLDAAVKRMTEAAESEGRNSLIMTTHEWKNLILSAKSGVRGLGLEIVKRAAGEESIEALNRWLALAMDIWNAMPETIRRLELRRIEQGSQDDSFCPVPVSDTEMDEKQEYVMRN